MYTMTKRANAAMRSRKRVHTPREVLTIEFVDKEARVHTKRTDTMNSLRRMGWKMRKQVSAPPPVATPKPSLPKAAKMKVNATDRVADAPAEIVPPRLATLNDMKMAELKSIAAIAGIRTVGTKAMLARRIYDHEMAQ